MKIIEETYKWARTNFTANNPNTIVIHHAASINCTAQDIHRWHIDRGWMGIAYHYFIEKDGIIYRGRQESHRGGHLYGSENDNTMGICLEGNYDTETIVPEAQINALVELCNDINKRWAIKTIKKHADYPSAKGDNKLCPGKYFPWDEFMAKMNGPEIMGISILTEAQMNKYLYDRNPNAPKDLAKMFLEEGIKEGVRGDIAFCQAIHETDSFRFTGTAQIEWNNPAGLGVTGSPGRGARFPDWRTGIRAQIQHLKAYSMKNPVFASPLVDPRYEAAKKAGYLGTAPRLFDLNGKWAVPGTTYGQAIMKHYDRIQAIQIDSDSEKIKLLTEEIEQLKKENNRLQAIIASVKALVS